MLKVGFRASNDFDFNKFRISVLQAVKLYVFFKKRS